MKMTKASANYILGVRNACARLKNVPGCAEGGEGHWSATKSAMEIALGRSLDSFEVAALSLTRYFGPLPGLKDDDAEKLFRLVWGSNNNDHGGWMSWSDLSEILGERYRP